MSHKISMQEAKEKFKWEQHCQELNNAGLKVDTLSRLKKKQLKRQSKAKRFTDMLFKRGGHVEQKEPKKKKGEQAVQQETEKAYS